MAKKVKSLVKENQISPYRKRILINIILLIVFFLVFAISFFFLWAMLTWNHMTIQELLFHMKVPLQGTGDFMVLKGALSILIPSSLLTAIFGILLFKVNERKKRKASISIMMTASLSFLLVLSCFAWNWLELTDFILLRHEKSTYIEENYVFPEEERYVFPEKKRNLVMIFLESMEVTLASEENGGAKKSFLYSRIRDTLSIRRIL